MNIFPVFLLYANFGRQTWLTTVSCLKINLIIPHIVPIFSVSVKYFDVALILFRLTSSSRSPVTVFTYFSLLIICYVKCPYLKELFVLANKENSLLKQ